ncbi:hypothetical protein Sjap_016066 [Stephania japonica]|uniref:Uncharacterized protein n=1 Tax=Stephania japonica TaxID=461633 RepID=A0AAP0IKC2_9MAGN
MSLPSKTRLHGKAEDFVRGLKEVHQTVKDNLQVANDKSRKFVDQKRRHVGFEVGDLFWQRLQRILSLLVITTSSQQGRLTWWRLLRR